MDKAKRNILVVDDQINLLTTLKFIFDEHGFNTTMVASSREAVEKVKETKFDIALLDVNMPEMDGLETFREIKKISSTTTVIMMTGYRESAQVKKCLLEGAVTAVYKPFAINKLIELMGKILKRPIVLIIDDKRDDRAVLKNSLEIQDYRVIEAQDGMTAIEKIKKGNFDICLVDFKMPGMNGLETINEIKRADPDIGVILLSGYTLEDAMRNEIKNGDGLTFIRKPYDMNNLMDIMEEEMKNKKLEE